MTGPQSLVSRATPRRAGGAGAIIVVLGSSLLLGAGPSGGAPARPPVAVAGSGKKPGEEAAKAAKLGIPEVTPMDVERLGSEMRRARGHAMFIHLWASWCGPCLEELPVIDRFAREARARGATFISVSLDDMKRGPHVLDVLRRRAPNLTAFIARFDDPDRFIALFSSNWEGAIPALFSYDRDGHLRDSVIGEVEPEDLCRMLAGLTPLPPRP